MAYTTPLLLLVLPGRQVTCCNTAFVPPHTQPCIQGASFEVNHGHQGCWALKTCSYSTTLKLLFNLPSPGLNAAWGFTWPAP